MATYFTNCQVKIDGTDYFATSFSINSSKGVQKLKALGKTGVSLISTEKPLANASADFYLTSDLSSFITKFKGKSDEFEMSAGKYALAGCRLTSLSLNGDAQGIVTASIAGESYSGATSDGSNDNAGGSITPAIGAKSTITATEVGFSDQKFSFSYDLSQSFNYFFTLGSGGDPTLTKFSEGDETVTVEGDGLPNSLAGLCVGSDDTISFSAKTCVGSEVMARSVAGVLTASDLNVSEGDIVKGSATIERGIEDAD